MSKTVTMKTKMTRKAGVLAALEKLGVAASDIQSGDGLVRDGYTGDKARVDILVRKSVFGGYGDLGLRQDAADKPFTVLVDDLDDRYALPATYGIKAKSFSVKLGQWYAATESARALDRKGLRTTITEKDNKLKVVGIGWKG